MLIARMTKPPTAKRLCGLVAQDCQLEKGMPIVLVKVSETEYEIQYESTGRRLPAELVAETNRAFYLWEGEQ